MVVGCTLSKAAIAPEIYERQFDAVIIDEASMAYIPHCVYAATLAKRRIAIFGDFRQLGPISQAETDNARTWLQRDIFEEAGIIDRVNRNQQDDRMVLLQTQYRMHPSISAIPNHLFYNNQLQDGEGQKC
jgi:superfamily I DNA and/or RNA helicase